MRVLVFHGYLLRGTGSNIYNAELARALVSLGHEVHLLCQDRQAAELPFVDAVGRFRGERLELEVVREPVRCTAYLPDIGGVLPLYVADEYEGFDARPFVELGDAEVERYVEANVVAVRQVAERADPQVALANHAVMGPAILARGLTGAVPYAVKIHGSALEYTVKRAPERFLPYAVEGLEPARGVLVGSRHTAESLWAAVPSEGLVEKTRLGPPGVDVHAFRPLPPADAARALRELADRVEAAGTAGWGGEGGAAETLRSLDPEREPIVTYVGKLLVAKGVDLLLAAWPLVVGAVPRARLCVVGFGTYRDGAHAIVDALRRADLASLRDIAERGRELEGGPPGRLGHLAAFLDGLEAGALRRYLGAAPAAASRIAFTGRLEHSDLPGLLPAAAAQVVPSTFPEAFGMVAAEAAACGVLPLSARHSGLAEVTGALAPALEPALRPLLSFERGPGAVEEIAANLIRWLSLDPVERAGAAASLAAGAHELFGWERVAGRVLNAAEGRLDLVPVPSS